MTAPPRTDFAEKVRQHRPRYRAVVRPRVLVDRQHASVSTLSIAGLRQQHYPHRAHDQELERVPDAQQHQQVELTRCTVADENRQDVHDREIRDGQQHRRHAPLQPATRADRSSTMLVSMYRCRKSRVWLLAAQIRRNMITVLSSSPATREQEDHSSRSQQVNHRIQRWATQVEAVPTRYRH